ncbi:MAG: GNAT family N-acetyltransferase [Flavobacteriaceae bacterium]|nr:MAG: GNAT family N-acetyltransferase [Flavobacteriaceae bacterium]
MEEVEIIPFESRYASDFARLNVEWLEKYFVVEPHDADLLERCESVIIDMGGYIFFAKVGAEIAGTFSLIKIDDKCYELGKMAVSPKYQGKRIGQKLMEECLAFSKSMDWDKLILYSNSKLKNALHIYRKYGFVDIPVGDNAPYERSDVKMERAL